jgi:thymidylate synthase
MKQYLDLLKNILENGVEKESGRANMPNTIGISGAEMRMNMEDGFPLLTTKKMFWKGIIHELLWIMHGDTNIKYLVDNDVNIWNGDAYRWYQKYCDIHHFKEDEIYTIIEFIEKIKENDLFQITKNSIWKDPKFIADIAYTYKLGDLGKVYGHQWRNQNGKVDQLADLIKGLQTNPYSRYHILDAWNKADFAEMALPPCHLLYQFFVRPLTKQEKIAWLNMNYTMYDDPPWTLARLESSGTDAEVTRQYDIPKFYLDLTMYQRSCDTFLGVPFNIASMSAFLMIMAKVTDMIPGVARWIGGDVHLYIAHISATEEQLERTPYELPKLIIRKNLKTIDDIMALTIDDFEILSYRYHPKITQELFTGYKR